MSSSAGWRRTITELAREFGASVRVGGRRLVIELPGGARVWTSKTPSRPAPDRVRRDIERALQQFPRTQDIPCKTS